MVQSRCEADARAFETGSSARASFSGKVEGSSIFFSGESKSPLFQLSHGDLRRLSRDRGGRERTSSEQRTIIACGCPTPFGQSHRLPERKLLTREGTRAPEGLEEQKDHSSEAEIERQRVAGTYVESVRRGPCRPKGSKDMCPRKHRGDAGVRLGPRKPKVVTYTSGT